MASPLPGRLETLAVARGDRVETGAPLFALDHVSEQAAQQQAADQLRGAEAQLADLRKGARPSEIAAVEARLQQSRAAADLSARELARQEQLRAAGASSVEVYDRARLVHEQNRHATDELAAQLETLRLGGRSDAIAASEARVSAARAVLAGADWNVAQKSQSATQSALVYDTLYRPGEFVAAARPVVVLLPPANLKVRFYVPEEEYSALRTGQEVRIHIDGRAGLLTGRVSYLSPQPEFTPPVLYNRENRAKLSFMVEASLAPADARDLHPGQPVEVTLVE
ncbi:MAG: HlyD family efflux transporter periplasmic adaptor subunit [Opitutaceae bacterium]|nr:HlyD family efflux transporter periplasmic adaptor subunit [Opitutaceae bacterium]